MWYWETSPNIITNTTFCTLGTEVIHAWLSIVLFTYKDATYAKPYNRSNNDCFPRKISIFDSSYMAEIGSKGIIIKSFCTKPRKNAVECGAQEV